MTSDQDVRRAIERLYRGWFEKGYRLQAVHTYRAADRTPLYWVARLQSDNMPKQIRPMCLNEKGEFISKRPEMSPMPLYTAAPLSAAPDCPVFVVEGEQKADLLSELGAWAVTSGSATSARGADWSSIRNRDVVIWPDNDEPGLRYASAVYELLQAQGCRVSVIDPAATGVPPKGDVVDWRRANPECLLDDILSFARLTVPLDALTAPATAPANASANEDKSQASMLVDFICASVSLVCDLNGEVFVQDHKTGETRRLNSMLFKDWLVATYYGMTGQSARDQSVREAIATVSGLARQQGKREPVYIRVGELDGAIYLDLGEPGSSRAVELRAGSWCIVDRPPVLFVRPCSMRPLPMPARDGKIEPLWDLVNIPQEDRLLVEAWLVEALRPNTPFPVLEIVGQQGAAKSTTQDLLRSLIDPAACNLRGAPRKVDDLYIAAGTNWIVSYENLSHLSSDLQDAMCVIATGGGFAKRRLYSDADEHVIYTHRPIVLNGISACVTNADLVDRSVSLDLPVIGCRREVTTLRSQFAELHGHLLGGLLNDAAATLAELPHQSLAAGDRPRLIEFAYLGMALACAKGGLPEDFLKPFHSRRAESIERTIEANPVASAVREWFEGRNRLSFLGTAKELYESVKKPLGADSWPGTVKAFCDQLRRVAPPLRDCGIQVISHGRKGGTFKYEVRLKS